MMRSQYLVFTLLVLVGCAQSFEHQQSPIIDSASAELSSLSSFGSSWSLVNTPAPATRVRAFSVDSANHWFVADINTGYWRSTDQGAHWTQINSGISLPLGRTINYDSIHKQLIAATVGHGSTPVEYYRSTNEGSSWVTIPVSFNTSPVPARTGPTYAPNGNIIFGGYWGDAWYSTDGAVTTRRITHSPITHGGDAFSFGYNPITNDLWMGTEDTGVFRSIDNGVTWNQVSPATKAVDPVHGISDGDILALTYDSSGNELMGTGGGIWKSSGSNGDYTWTNILVSYNYINSMFRDSFGNLYYGHDRDPNFLTIVSRSTNQGRTWSAYDTGLPAGSIVQQFLQNSTDGKLYITITDPTDKGFVYRR